MGKDSKPRESWAKGRGASSREAVMRVLPRRVQRVKVMGMCPCFLEFALKMPRWVFTMFFGLLENT